MISDDERFECAERVRGDCERVCTFLLGLEFGLRMGEDMGSDAIAVCAASRRLNRESLDLVFMFDQAAPSHAKGQSEGGAE